MVIVGWVGVAPYDLLYQAGMCLDVEQVSVGCLNQGRPFQVVVFNPGPCVIMPSCHGSCAAVAWAGLSLLPVAVLCHRRRSCGALPGWVWGLCSLTPAGLTLAALAHSLVFWSCDQ